MMHKFLVQIDDKGGPWGPGIRLVILYALRERLARFSHCDGCEKWELSVIHEEREPDICPQTIPDDKFFVEGENL